MDRENDRPQKEAASEFMTNKKAKMKESWQRQKGSIWRWAKRIVLCAVALVALFYLAVLISAWI